MAKQVGFLKLVGTLGDISFYKSIYGYLARTKTGVDRKTVLTDPRFQRTRENASEFGRAAKAGKLLRVAIRPLLIHAKDSMTVQRLAQRMVKVLQTDTINRRGMRTVADGDLNLLNGFDFNSNAKLDSIIQIGYETEFDRVTGMAILNFQSYIPRKNLMAANGTTHYKISFGVAALDFDVSKSGFNLADSNILPYDGSIIPSYAITINFPSNLPLPIVLVLGVEFYQEVNGEFFILEDGRFNALGVVGVDNETRIVNKKDTKGRLGFLG